jgi:transmembrane sensor
MQKSNKKNIDFVLHYYKAGKLDTRKAIRKFKEGKGTERELHPWRYVSIAATLLILIAAGAIVLFHKDTTTLVASNIAKTYLLPDKSKITLAPHSTLSYKGDDYRKVAMTGKIYFEVKHDNTHPFDITGDMSHVRVLGTKFQVAENRATSEVYVTSGKVMFAAKSSADGIILTQGMKAVLGKGDAKPQLVQNSDINQTAWATHQFHFDNTPINDVMQQLSAYYGVSLSASENGKRLSGDFDASDINDITSIIEETLNIKISKK